MNKDNEEKLNKDAPENNGCCGGDCGCNHGEEEEESGYESEKDFNKQIEELEENWKRALADYQNLQKRFAKEKTQIINFANSVLVMKLLPILDNLEMMKKHSNEEGLEMIINEFKRILEEEGVEEIEAKGKEFDSQTMEAIESVDGEPGKVMEVTRKGYKFKDKVLRPVEVKVGRDKEE